MGFYASKKVFLLIEFTQTAIYSQLSVVKSLSRCNILSHPALNLFQFKVYAKNNEKLTDPFILCGAFGIM